MMKVLGISGSLRALSFNTALLRAAQAAGDDVQIRAATLHDLPLYDGVLEQRDGTPRAVKAIKPQRLANDGLLLLPQPARASGAHQSRRLSLRPNPDRQAEDCGP